jgi:hypothetical protein
MLICFAFHTETRGRDEGVRSLPQCRPVRFASTHPGPAPAICILPFGEKTDRNTDPRWRMNSGRIGLLHSSDRAGMLC